MRKTLESVRLWGPRAAAVGAPRCRGGSASSFALGLPFLLAVVTQRWETRVMSSRISLV